MIDEKLVVDPKLVIEYLESTQPRAIREALLTGDLTRLEEIEEQIVRMRALLKA